MPIIPGRWGTRGWIEGGWADPGSPQKQWARGKLARFRARPPAKVAIKVSLPPLLISDLDDYARGFLQTRSRIIRDFLAERLEWREEDQRPLTRSPRGKKLVLLLRMTIDLVDSLDRQAACHSVTRGDVIRNFLADMVQWKDKPSSNQDVKGKGPGMDFPSQIGGLSDASWNAPGARQTENRPVGCPGARQSLYGAANARKGHSNGNPTCW